VERNIHPYAQREKHQSIPQQIIAQAARGVGIDTVPFERAEQWSASGAQELAPGWPAAEGL
jgi:hypothetical protein